MLLGDIYDKYDRFNLCLNTVAQSYAIIGLTSPNDDQCLIRINGLPWINNSYNISANGNNNTANTIIGSFQFISTFAITTLAPTQYFYGANMANIAPTPAAGSLFAISNVEYVANFIELSDVVMGMIQQSLQGQPLQFVIPDYRNFGGSYTTATTTASQYNFAIPAKFSSLKSLFVTIRDKQTGALAYFPYSCVTNGLTDYYFRVGSQIMPTKVPNTIPEQF